MDKKRTERTGWQTYPTLTKAGVQIKIKAVKLERNAPGKRQKMATSKQAISKENQESVVKREDRRVRRTKKMLTQALTQLLQEKQAKDITVKELTELADMNRGTFYLYYKDVYDMLEKLEDNLFASLDKIIETPDPATEENSTQIILQDLFRFIEENREICRLLLSPHGDMNFLHRLNAVLQEKCKNYFRATGVQTTDKRFDYLYNFVVFGCAGAIRAWVNDNCKESPEDMANLVAETINSVKLPRETDKE